MFNAMRNYQNYTKIKSVNYLKKHSDRYYYIHYQSNGKETSFSTKCKTKNEALKFLANFQKELEERKLQELINDFLQFSLAVHKPKTFKGYKITLKFLFEYFGNIPIKEITTVKLNDYFVQRINTSSIYQARKDFICINSMFNRAVAEGYLVKNPCDNIKRFKIPQKQPLFFTELQFDLLLSVIDSKVIRDIVILGVQTGMSLLRKKSIDILIRLQKFIFCSIAFGLAPESYR